MPQVLLNIDPLRAHYQLDTSILSAIYKAWRIEVIVCCYLVAEQAYIAACMNGHVMLVLHTYIVSVPNPVKI